jgi:predicted nucleic acid-binding protein
LSSREAEKQALLDADVFISYIKGDEMVEHSESVVEAIMNGRLEAYISSMLFDDVITGLRSKGMEIGEVIKVILAIASINHTPFPITSSIAVNALMLYDRHGGSRRLHYFDAFHVATAKINDLPMVTSDKYIIEHKKELGIKAIDLRTQ